MAGRAAMSLDYASRLRTSTDTRHDLQGERCLLRTSDHPGRPGCRERATAPGNGGPGAVTRTGPAAEPARSPERWSPTQRARGMHPTTDLSRNANDAAAVTERQTTAPAAGDRGGCVMSLRCPCAGERRNARGPPDVTAVRSRSQAFPSNKRTPPAVVATEGVRALDVNGPGVLPAGAVRRARDRRSAPAPPAVTSARRPCRFHRCPNCSTGGQAAFPGGPSTPFCNYARVRLPGWPLAGSRPPPPARQEAGGSRPGGPKDGSRPHSS
jgi:hypothetical protein